MCSLASLCAAFVVHGNAVIQKHTCLIFILLLTLLSCSTSQNKQQATSADTSLTKNLQPQPVVIESEDEGWSNDIKLSYTNSLITNEAVIYQINSIYENQILGFEVSVPRHGFTQLTIKSTGKNSDNFLHFLGKLYKQKVVTSAKFIDAITAECINMGDYIDSLNNQSKASFATTVQYKLFFQGQNEDDYAELYLNINDTQHQIELKEKDEEYRPIIIKLLTKK